MNLTEARQTSNNRLIDLLKYSLGSRLVDFLKDDDVVEIMINDDNKVWIDTLSRGMYFTNIVVDPNNTFRVIQTVATYVDKIVDYKTPIISAELPESESRFEGIIPPNVRNPTISIRKKGIKIFTLDDYVSFGTLTENQKNTIVNGVKNHKNFLIVGGTSTGKTTFANAVIGEISRYNERLNIIEDTREIQSKSENTVFLRTSEFVTMRDLLKSCMRLRPDRILVGEVRDGAALDLITAWNSGHPGGISTIHSDSAYGGLKQLEQYIQRVSVSKQEELIAKTVNIIVVLKRVVDGVTGKVVRKVDTITQVNGFENGKYILEKIDKIKKWKKKKLKKKKSIINKKTKKKNNKILKKHVTTCYMKGGIK